METSVKLTDMGCFTEQLSQLTRPPAAFPRAFPYTCIFGILNCRRFGECENVPLLGLHWHGPLNRLEELSVALLTIP